VEKEAITPRDDPKKDDSEVIVSEPVAVGSVTSRTIGSSSAKKHMHKVFNHVVGLLPNGKPLNVVTHGDHIKVLNPVESPKTSRKALLSPKSNKRLGKSRYSYLSQSMGYDSLFRTNNYHIVNGKDTKKAEYNIIPNTLDYKNKLFEIERHPEKFAT
jgi:hypothetical protein